MTISRSEIERYALLVYSATVMFTLLYRCYISIRECSFEKCWGGRKMGGGHANSVLDLGGAK